METQQRKSRFDKLSESPRLVGETWDRYESWLKRKSPDVRESYLYSFTKFLEWIDTDTEGLFQSALKDMREGEENPLANGRIPLKIADFMTYRIETDEIKAISAKKDRQAIIGFLKSCGFDTDNIQEELKEYQPKANDLGSIGGVSKDQLRDILKVVGRLRVRAVFLTAKDTGIRVGDLTLLTVGIYNNAITRVVGGETYKTLEFMPSKNKGKSNLKANPVIGPETVEAVDQWLAERVKRGIPTGDETPLFCAVKNRGAVTTSDGRYLHEVRAGDFLNPSTFSNLFSSYRRKASIELEEGQDRLPSIHSLRKYNSTQLTAGLCPERWINIFQGRRGTGTQGTYQKPNPDQLIKAYVKAYPHLKLWGGADMVRGPEINGIKSRLEIAEDEAKEYKSWAETFRENAEEKDKELQETKAELKELRALVEKLLEENGQK